MKLSTCRRHPSAPPFVMTCSGCAQDTHDAQYGKTPPSASVAAPRPLRTATVADVVKRLTGDLYDKTAIDALGWGMGPAQNGINEAVAEAAAAGLVVVTTERGKRFVHLAPKPTAGPAAAPTERHPLADAVFAAATSTTWTRTNLGPRAEIAHGGYTWTVELPASGQGQAYITGRYGYGGTEHLDLPATWSQTAAIVDAAMASLRA